MDEYLKAALEPAIWTMVAKRRGLNFEIRSIGAPTTDYYRQVLRAEERREELETLHRRAMADGADAFEVHIARMEIATLEIFPIGGRR